MLIHSDLIKASLTATLILFGVAVDSPAGQTDKAPPQELVQYVSGARKLGVKVAEIKKSALAAGWPASQVDRALAENSPGKAPADTNSGKSLAAATPSIPAPTAPDPHEKVDRGVSEDYEIGSGDVLQIAVWKEPEVSVPSVVVRPDGKVTMPLLKEVEVAGMTPVQVEKAITERASKFINGADVTVVVKEIHSKKIYLLGAVKKEGPIPYTYRMSLMQAISEAGGLTEYAKRKKIYVLRNENGKDVRMPFNYEEALRGERMEQNIALLPGDMIVVPQ